MLTSVVRILVTSLVATALTWIVYRWARASFPALARHRRALPIVLFAPIPLNVLSRIVTNSLHWTWAAQVQAASLGILMSIAIAAIPIGLMRIVIAPIAWLAKRRRDPVQSPPITRRQLVEGVGGAAFLAATGSMIGWGMVRGRHAFEIADLVVKLPGLPRALDGYVIAQISDIHTGLYVDERQIDEGLSRLAEVRPDLVVVTGDLVDFDPVYAPLIARKLGSIAARDGVTTILGNHDYYTGAGIVTDALRAAGVDLLVNRGKIIRAQDGGGFALLGVDDLLGARRGGAGPLLTAAERGIADDVPRVLLSHQPDTVSLWSGRVPLQLSGHTHGGQINPGFCLADLVLRYVAGRYDVYGTTLYVNRGFGTVGPPSRVGAPPEVTRVVLVTA
jgi:predicted MPP superfamily phosphohydrolase